MENIYLKNIEASLFGSFIFVSGLMSRDVHGTVIGEGDMRAQIRQVTRNLEWALASAGASLKDVVRTCTFTTDIDEFFRHPIWLMVLNGCWARVETFTQILGHVRARMFETRTAQRPS